MNPPKLIGLENYRYMFADKDFYHSMGVTLKYLVISVPLYLCRRDVAGAAVEPEAQRHVYFPDGDVHAVRDRRNRRSSDVVDDAQP